MRFLLLFSAACLAQCADNVLTPAERQAGFQLLFDGKTMQGWRNEGPHPESSWAVQDGALKTRPNSPAESLLSEESYGDFELTFDWFVSAGANSGVKYRVQRVACLDKVKAAPGPLNHETNPRRCDERDMRPEAKDRGSFIGIEFQLLGRDEAKGPPYKDARFATGALYGMIAPSAFPGKPPGEWNQGRIVVKGDHAQHWINGVKVVDGSMSSDEAKAGVLNRFPAAAAYRDVLLNSKPGPIYLQHHGGSDIRFKNLKIRRM